MLWRHREQQHRVMPWRHNRCQCRKSLKRRSGSQQSLLPSGTADDNAAYCSGGVAKISLLLHCLSLCRPLVFLLCHPLALAEPADCCTAIKCHCHQSLLSTIATASAVPLSYLTLAAAAKAAVVAVRLRILDHVPLHPVVDCHCRCCCCAAWCRTTSRVRLTVQLTVQRLSLSCLP
jgi:hypothetical protein